VFLEPVGLSVEVLQDDRVERGEVLGEELVDREGDEREVLLRRIRVVRLCPEDEERDDVDGCIALQPLPERAYVVRRAPGDVEDADALTGDDEGEDPVIVLRDRVARRWGDRDLDDAGAGPLERDGEIDRSLAVLEMRQAAGQQGGGPVFSKLACGDGELVAREASAATDLDAQRQRHVGNRGARRRDTTHARIGGAFARRRDGVDRDLELTRERAEVLRRRVLHRVVQPAVGDDHDRLGTLLRRCRKRAKRRTEVAARRDRRAGSTTLLGGEGSRRSLSEPEHEEA